MGARTAFRVCGVFVSLQMQPIWLDKSESLGIDLYHAYGGLCVLRACGGTNP